MAKLTMREEIKILRNDITTLQFENNKIKRNETFINVIKKDLLDLYDKLDCVELQASNSRDRITKLEHKLKHSKLAGIFKRLLRVILFPIWGGLLIPVLISSLLIAVCSWILTGDELVGRGFMNWYANLY